MKIKENELRDIIKEILKYNAYDLDDIVNNAIYIIYAYISNDSERIAEFFEKVRGKAVKDFTLEIEKE